MQTHIYVERERCYSTKERGVILLKREALFY